MREIMGIPPAYREGPWTKLLGIDYARAACEKDDSDKRTPEELERLACERLYWRYAMGIGENG